MRLKQLQYEQHIKQPHQWTVGPVELDVAMLLVGKNAAGKSRTLSILWSLAALMQGRQKQILAGTWKVAFEDRDETIEYALDCTDDFVRSEELTINGQMKLRRDHEGKGELDAVASGNTVKLPFQVPTQSVAVVAKRDLLQHPYLEPLHRWASSLRFYPFGTDMGRSGFGVLLKEAPPADPSDWRLTLGVFTRGEKEFPKAFQSKVVSYMETLGYSLEKVQLLPVPLPENASETQLPGPLVCLAAKERDLPCLTTQVEMSQGMFRALALMIHLAYAELTSQPSCILLDDVGEGLDFERSAQLIKLLLEIAQKKKVQVLMSTNDRFVMNTVPLEHWAIIRRKASHCEILNYHNSRQMFEDFKMTGLSNFDLLRSGFFEQAPPTIG